MESVDFSSVTTGDTYLKNHELEHVEKEGLQETGGGDSAPTAQSIYGRSAEIAALLQTYQRLLATKRAHTVIVHGESGSGKKTALVDMLREPVCEANTYFVAGKFFQLDANVSGEPYSAIMAVFSDLCDLVIQADDYDEDQRREMKESLSTT
jgi:predicted ATPase